MRVVQNFPRKWRVCVLVATVLGSSCGPARKAIDKPKPSAPVAAGKEAPKQSPSAGSRNSRELMPLLADSLGLRSFDFEGLEGQDLAGEALESQGTSRTTRVCDDSNQPDLGITTLRQEWSEGFARELSGWKFVQGEGLSNTRLETWSRPGGLFCSPEQWVKVGWQDSSNLAGLQTQVQIQLMLSKSSGSRETERYLTGTRQYVYSAEGHSLSGRDVTVSRSLIIGSPQLPNTVRVVLRENGTELRRTSGQIYTDPDHPIQEVLVRRLGDLAVTNGDNATNNFGAGSVVTISKFIKSGVILARQVDGTLMKTTIENLEYLGRKADGSFSCVPRSGKITDEISFDLPQLKGVVTVTREASAQGVVLTSQCSAGLSVEDCSDLIQKSLRQALTPYCLY